jgi:multidrug resistance protein MdtO
MMTTATAGRTDTRGFTAWFADFLRSELAPYPGRGMLVARMVISATITMILIMTFRIPGGATGPLYAFLISRENLTSSARSAFYLIIAFGLCALFVPLGAHMFGSIPLTHFCWEGVSIFLIFFLIRTLENYTITSGIALIGSSALAIWYLPGPADTNIENTLWAVLAPTIGALVTIAVEVVFHTFHKQDELITGLNRRLKTIEDVLRCYAECKERPRALERRITQDAMVGVSSLRRAAMRSSYTRLYRAQMNAIVSLTGRSVDFAAALTHTNPELSTPDQQVAWKLAEHLAAIQKCLASGCVPPTLGHASSEGTMPLLRELEEMFSLIPKVLEGSAELKTFEAFTENVDQGFHLFIRDAFQNPDHVRYALSGCLAGMLCYITYMALDWPGLATSVTTCALTALSNIGASRQKQLLLVAGAVIGGFIFGMGAQIMVLPWLDGITGFTLFFAAVTAVAAWIGTSSTRLSYCGLQMALAFYLINVNEFRIQLSLSIARNRALGVLLGIFMMWLVFERLHPKSAVNQMVETFTRNLGLLGQLSEFTLPGHDASAITRVRRLRARIFDNFGAVNAQADAVPFEIGPRRNQHMAARDRIRRWQAMLRSFYLLELALLQYTAFAIAETLTSDILRDLEEFDRLCSQRLAMMAESLRTQSDASPDAPLLPQPECPAWPGWLQHGSQEEAQHGILSLATELARILDRLWQDMSSAPLYAVE